MDYYIWNADHVHRASHHLYIERAFRMNVTSSCSVSYHVKTIQLSKETQNKQLVFQLELTNISGSLNKTLIRSNPLVAKVLWKCRFINEQPQIDFDQIPIVNVKNDNCDPLMIEFLNISLLRWIKQNSDVFQKCISNVNQVIINGQRSPLKEVSRLSDEQYSLQGWDMVYATTFSQINREIINEGLYPTQINTIIENNLYKASLIGGYSNWKVISGSDGRNIQFKLSFTRNTKFWLSANQEKEFFLNEDDFVIIQMTLDSLSDTDQVEDSTGNNDGEHQKIALNIKSPDDVIIIKTQLPAEIESSITLQAAFKTLLNAWIRENYSCFRAIFTRYQLKETAKEPNFNWIKPTFVKYAVATHVDTNGDDDVFGVLSMVENDEQPNTQIVDPRIFQGTDFNVAVLLTYKKYLWHFLYKSLDVIHIAQLDDFAIDEDNLTIRNKSKLQLCTYKSTSEEDQDWQGEPGYIEPGCFELALRNNVLQLKITNLKFSHDGVNGYITYEEISKLVLKSGIDDTGKAYNNVLVPETISDSYTMQTEIEAWKQREEAVIKFMTGIIISLNAAIMGYAFGSALGSLIKKTISKAGSFMKFSSTSLKKIEHLIGVEEAALAKKEISESLERQLAAIPTPGLTAGSISLLKQTPFLIKSVFNRFSLGEVMGTSLAMSGQNIATNISNAKLALEQNEFSALPSVNPLSANIVQAIQWPTNKEIVIKDMEFKSAYVIRGERA
ncbi:TULIP family P47-like protein [Furfurilactobacillus entadae]|uniref:TULIP family P47-like protein n=1 Tax=Furfurilactobacillus entadae TaxID=2922307 RepID=UPI0035E97AD7